MARFSSSLSSLLLRTTNRQNLTRKSQRIHIRFLCDGSPVTSPQRPGLLALYRNMVEQGKLQHDPHQERVAYELENLLGRLKQYEKDMEEYHENLANWENGREDERRKLLMEEAEARQEGGVWTATNKQRSSFVEKYILRKRNDFVEPGVGKWVSYLNRERKLDSKVGRRPVAPPAPKGLYLYGNVGSGKTMLMDMFYSATEGIVKHRRRFHFHEAMLQIHEHMHKIWKDQVEQKSFQSGISSWILNLPFDTKVKEWLIAEERYKQDVQMKNILPAVADKFLVDRQAGQRGASILCFDEIQTVDVFAIVALSGIVSRLLSTGTVLVATSNRAPEDLNQAHYFWPLDVNALREFEKLWSEVINHTGEKVISNTIPVMFGRTLEVPESCDGIARFEFDFLCGRPLGAADYIAIARNYHTVFISDIPVMSMRIRDKARRFITLIDELYNHHCCLFCTAAASIEDLFQGTDEGTLFDLESFQFETEIEGGKLRRDALAEGTVSSAGAPSAIVSLLSGKEEMFAFRRAVSRLIEMHTPLYLDGVAVLHPYFQKQTQAINHHVKTSEFQPSAGPVLSI